MSSFAELYIDQGSTFNLTITLDDDITNSAINLSSYTIKSQIKKSYYSQNVSDNLVCTIMDSSNGIIALSLPSANTANLSAGRYVFDMTMNNSGDISRVLEGIVFVSPGVTS